MFFLVPLLIKLKEESKEIVNKGIATYIGKHIWFNENKRLQEKYKNTNWKRGK